MMGRGIGEYYFVGMTWRFVIGRCNADPVVRVGERETNVHKIRGNPTTVIDIYYYYARGATRETLF